MPGCPKIGYSTQGEAKHMMKRVIREHPGRGGLRVYHCKRCGLWHHGRKEKNRRG